MDTPDDILTEPPQYATHSEDSTGDAARYDRWVLATRRGLRPNPIHEQALLMHVEFLHRVTEPE